MSGEEQQAHADHLAECAADDRAEHEYNQSMVGKETEQSKYEAECDQMADIQSKKEHSLSNDVIDINEAVDEFGSSLVIPVNKFKKCIQDIKDEIGSQGRNLFGTTGDVLFISVDKIEGIINTHLGEKLSK